MTGVCDGRTIVVTGAGRGIGRAHALELGRQGALVVVNDLSAPDGGANPAEEVAEEIRAAGGIATASGANITDEGEVKALVDHALTEFGRLDGVVNNAGILRDRMLVNLSIDDWEAVMAVHLRGTFLLSRAAAAYWRTRSKAGEPVDARIINTTSRAGLLGNVGQGNYAAAKAGVASMTRIMAVEVERYGITVNAIAPAARTRMTEALFMERMKAVEGFDPMDPETVSPFVAWLAGSGSGHVTGRVFSVIANEITHYVPWTPGPSARKDERWDPAEIGPVVDRLLAESPPDSFLDNRGLVT